MTDRWELYFDGMPPNPNARLHYRARARSAKHWRRLASLYYVTLGARIPPQERVRITAVFSRRAVGRADPDNDLARCKNLVDGLVDAGLVPNDTYRHVVWGACREAKGRPGVTLIIETVENS